MSKELIIDRFEGDLAVIESDNEFFEIPRALLPKEAKEGDHLEIKIQTTASSDALERQKRLEKRDRGDDIIDL